MIEDATEAAERLIGFMESGKMPVIDGDPIALDADSICVHGDSEHAVSMAAEIRRRLSSEGIEIKPFMKPSK